jgi:hypothetical protein
MIIYIGKLDQLNRDFPFVCLPKTGVSCSDIKPPSQKICKSFFQPGPGFFPAMEEFQHHFSLSYPFSPRSEDSSFVTALHSNGTGNTPGRLVQQHA